MPTYQYQCDNCDETLEVFQSITDKKLKECPKCKKETLHRLIGRGGAIVFKGTGFYETDYKRSSETKPSESPAKESKPAPSSENGAAA